MHKARRLIIAVTCLCIVAVATPAWGTGSRSGSLNCGKQAHLAATAREEGSLVTASATAAGLKRTTAAPGIAVAWSYSNASTGKWEATGAGGTFIADASYGFCEHV